MCAAVIPPSQPRTQHRVGLPGAANGHELPRPSVVLLDGTPDGFFLIRLNKEGVFCGDTWHLTAEEALSQAAFEFESVGTWHEIPAEVSDAQAYAIRHATTG
jgi:hypothetical protein